MARKSQRITIDIETRARLEAIEKSQKEIRELTGEIEKTTRRSKDLREAGGSLRGAFRMGGAIAGFTALLNVATRLTSQLPALTREVIRGGDAIAKKSELYGVSTDMLQEFRFAAEQTGVGTNTADMALQRFTRRFGEAAEGAGELLPVLERYNIAVKDSEGNTRAVEEVMGDLADLIAATPSRAERLRIAFKAFDSEGAALVNTLRNGSEGLDELRREAQDAGVVLSGDTVDSFEQAQSAMDAFTASAKARFAEVVVQVVDAIDAITDFSGRLAARRADVAALRSLTGQDFRQGRRETGLDYAERIGRAIERTGKQRIADEKEALELLEERALFEQAFAELGGREVPGRGRGSNARPTLEIEGEEVDDIREVEAVRARALELARAQVAARKEAKETAKEEKEQAAAANRETEKQAARERILAELAEMQAKFDTRRLEVAERLPALREDLVEAEQELESLLNSQELDESEIKKAKKEILGLTREILAIEKELTDETASQAEKINALADLKGLRAIGNDRFIDDNLSKAEQAKAGVQGQEALEFDPAVGDFVGTGDFSGGLNDPQAHFQTMGQGALAAVYEYQAAVGTLADQVNVAFSNIFQGIEQGISTSITGLIDGTMSWGDALANIRNTIIQSVIDSFAQMAAEWITNQIMMATVGDALRAKAVASNAGAAAATAAAWTPAAILSSIASFGKAAAIGAAAVFAFSKIAGFKDGGLISGPGGPREDSILARLSSGEFVVNAAATAQHRPLLEAINNGQPTPRFADGGPVGSGGTGSGSPQRIVLVDSRRDADRLRRDPEFENLVIEIGRRERNAF